MPTFCSHIELSLFSLILHILHPCVLSIYFFLKSTCPRCSSRHSTLTSHHLYTHPSPLITASTIRILVHSIFLTLLINIFIMFPSNPMSFFQSLHTFYYTRCTYTIFKFSIVPSCFFVF